MERIGRTWRVKIGSFEPRLLEKPPVVPRAMSREPVIFTTVRSRHDLERRVTGVLTRLIDSTTDLSTSIYIVLKQPCTLQLKCRSLWNAIYRTLVEQCGPIGWFEGSVEMFLSRRRSNSCKVEFGFFFFFKFVVENRECLNLSSCLKFKWCI